jgi:hypothetical protein
MKEIDAILEAKKINGGKNGLIGANNNLLSQYE